MATLIQEANYIDIQPLDRETTISNNSSIITIDVFPTGLSLTDEPKEINIHLQFDDNNEADVKATLNADGEIKFQQDDTLFTYDYINTEYVRTESLLYQDVS